MGLVYSIITLKNPIQPSMLPLDACFVERSATYLCIPAHIAHQLSLHTLHEKKVTLTNKESFLVPYVEPMQVHFENKMCFAGSVVLGDACLLGAIPIKDMDLIIHPKLFKLAVNPESPNIVGGVAKSLPIKTLF